ncbi:MAG: helix-turn-helix domain-containing protein [Carbonactinosporaceae bacterium]
MAQPGGGPTVRRILLGSQLRQLREARGVTREDAGYEIRASESKISRLELGRVGFKERDVADLLTLYGVTDDDERAALLTMAREANSPGWWHNYSDVLPSWFQAYVGLEEAAALIRTYEVQFVPGLLQTEDYARAVISQGQADAPKAEIDRRVGLRMARQRLFDKPNAPLLWAVLDESALRRPLGGPTVMRDQLAKLIAVTDLPNVTLQIMPFPFGGHPAESGAFTILRFPELDLPDVVYLEQLTGALYLDKRDEVDQYLRVIESLAFASTTPKQTLDTLTAMRDQF